MATQDTASTPTNSREVLAERLRSLTYEVDHTAANPANRVVEVRTLTDANRSSFNHIIPKAAPFFAHTVRIFHIQTNDELINGQDFYCVGTFVKAVTNVVDHREVNWAIIFDDQRISGEYRIEYQTVGGEFVLDQQQMAEILANFVENPRSTDWERIVGRPLTFPPLPHDIHVDNLVGFNEQVAATHGIEEAIRALIGDEERDHPGYGQVITELFRQQQRQDKFQQTIDEMRIQNSQSSAALGERLAAEDSRIESESKARDRELEERINNDIKKKLDKMDTDYKEADADLTAKINKAKTDLTNSLNEKDASLRALIEEKDNAQSSARNNAISGLNATLQSTNTSIRADFAAADRALDRKIEALRTSTTTAIASSLGEAKGYTDRKFQEATQALTNHISDNNRDFQDLRTKIEANKTLSTQTDEGLRRDLTTETNARIEGDKGLGKRIDGVEASLGTKAAELTRRIDNLSNTSSGIRSDLEALKARVDSNGEVVKIAGSQVITGSKTFTGTIFLRNANNSAQTSYFGANSTDTHIYNAASGKFLQLRNNGNLEYDSKKVLLQPDYNNLNNAITAVRNSLSNFVTLTTNQDINGIKSFKHRIRLRRENSDTIYSEWSFGSNNLFRYYADGRDRMWLDNDGRFHTPRGLSIGNTGNRDNSDYRWSNFTVNWNDADPYLILTGAGGGEAAANYGRLSVHDLYVRSDKRIKHDIEKIRNATDKLEAINGYTYFLNGSKTKSGGVIAQELVEVMPEIVHLRQGQENEPEYYSVQYHGVIALLVEALKESNERIRKLEEKLDV